MKKSSSEQKGLAPFAHNEEAIQPLFFLDNSNMSEEQMESINPLADADELQQPLFFLSTENVSEQSAAGIEVLEFIEPKNVIKPESNGITMLPKKGDEKKREDAEVIVSSENQAVNKNVTPWISASLYPAANFEINIRCKKIYIDRNGKENFEKGTIECVIVINGVPHKFEVKNNEIASICKKIKNMFPEAIIDYEIKKAEKAIELQFRRDVARSRSVNIYFQAGWQKIGNSYVYLYDGVELGPDMMVNTGLTLPRYQCNKEYLADVFRRACNLGSNMTAMPVMVVFSFMGILYRLFKKAGYAPRFTLFLNGKTGSMKTTIGKMLFVQLCEEQYRDTPRRIDTDTAVSLERAIVSAGHDTVTLIDDFSPAKTEMKNREVQDKLEMVIRMVGDGSSRSRSNINLEDNRGEGVQGMVVLTGELMGKGVSSNLRCLYCKMQRENANVENVSWFQEHPYAYTTLLAEFAEYVGPRYERMIAYIRDNFAVERREMSRALSERRLIDTAATLCLASDILQGFLLDCCGMERSEVNVVISMMRSSIVDCAYISQEMSKDESPSEVFIQSIAALMRMNQIVLNTGKITMNEISEYDGFEDEKYFYFNPETVHKKVVAFVKQTNRYFPFDLREIQVMLADDKIIKTASNGLGKRTFCARIPVGNGKKLSFLKISKEIFCAIAEGRFDFGEGVVSENVQ